MTETYREQSPAANQDDGLECYFVVVMYEMNNGIHYKTEYARSFDRLGAYRETIHGNSIPENTVLRFSVTSIDLIVKNNNKLRYEGKTIASELT